MRILVADDNFDNRDMLARRLRRKGFDIDVAVDGRETIDMAVREQFDLILMDISMPEISGLDATRYLKENALTRHLPIIALTAHASEADRQKALAAGCDDFATKPIDLAALLTKIELCCKPTA